MGSLLDIKPKTQVVKKQIIIKDGVVKCTTAVPYPSEVIKQMKKVGYKIKEKII